jgi:hypothetical protein
MYGKTQELEELVIKTGGNGGVSSKVKAGTLDREVVNRIGSKVEAETRALVKVTAEEVKVQLEAQLQAAYEKAASTPRKEVAEPLFWWDLYAIGPIQPDAGFYGVTPPPFLPHRVIRAGEEAYIATILILNPFPLPVPPYGLVPSDILSNFCLPYKIEYHTCDTTNCTKGPANLNVTHEGHFVPGHFIYVDILHFKAERAGCIFETNICARILGCEYKDKYGRTIECTAPPFAGFARWIVNLDPDLLFGAPLFEFDNPVRFMVYE